MNDSTGKSSARAEKSGIIVTLDQHKKNAKLLIKNTLGVFPQNDVSQQVIDNIDEIIDNINPSLTEIRCKCGRKITGLQIPPENHLKPDILILCSKCRELFERELNEIREIADGLNGKILIFLQAIFKKGANNSMDKTDSNCQYPDEDNINLGPCCICEKTGKTVRNIILLEKKCTIPGHGWGCVICDLSSDGASAVLCGDCMKLYESGEAAIKFACRGYPATDGRISVGELPGDHKHDMEKHRKFEQILKIYQ